MIDLIFRFIKLFLILGLLQCQKKTAEEILGKEMYKIVNSQPIKSECSIVKYYRVDETLCYYLRNDLVIEPRFKDYFVFSNFIAIYDITYKDKNYKEINKYDTNENIYYWADYSSELKIYRIIVNEKSINLYDEQYRKIQINKNLIETDTKKKYIGLVIGHIYKVFLNGYSTCNLHNGSGCEPLTLQFQFCPVDRCRCASPKCNPQ